MATYQYSIQSSDGRNAAYVDYNIAIDIEPETPWPEATLIGLNTEVTITGRAYAKDFAIKSIRAVCKFGYGTYYAWDACLGYVNKTIAKNTVGTFTIKFKIPKATWDWLKSNIAGVNYVWLDHMWFLLDASANSPSAVQPTGYDPSTDGDLTDTNSTMSQQDDYWLFVQTPVSPDISGITLADMAANNPLSTLGVVTQNQSQPRMTMAWSIDWHHPAMSCAHSLTLTGAMAATYEASTGSGVSSVNFDLPTPTAAGTVNWTYTVTDMFGNSDTETGSFAVYAYSPPAITNLLLERYAVVPDAGGEAHEASDDGTHLWLTLAAGIAAVNSRNAWTAVMTYWDAALGESAAVTVTSQDGWSLGGTDGTTISLARDEAQLAGITADDTKDWRFRLTITDALGNSATLVYDGIVKAGAVLDVSPGGVGVGMRCTGTEGGGEKFQCAYTAEFKNSVAVGSGNLLKVVSITVMSNKSISANSYSDGSVSASAVQTAIGTGWKPLGVLNVRTTDARCVPTQFYCTEAEGAYASVRNVTSSAATLTLVLHVLCIRTSL